MLGLLKILMKKNPTNDFFDKILTVSQTGLSVLYVISKHRRDIDVELEK